MANQIDVRNQGSKRLPPGQVETRKWPVLHYGTVPMVDLATWRFRINGEVEHQVELTWDELLALPRQQTFCDIHCVTRWSRYDNQFEGISVSALLAMTKPRPGATHALIHAEHGYTTNIPLADLDLPANLVALSHNGAPLEPEHGGPVRLLVPHLYFWKSAKWIRSIELMEGDYPGFWEQNGYHMRGDPWTEERYGRPDPVRMRRGPRA